MVEEKYSTVAEMTHFLYSYLESWHALLVGTLLVVERADKLLTAGLPGKLLVAERVGKFLAAGLPGKLLAAGGPLAVMLWTLRHSFVPRVLVCGAGGKIHRMQKRVRRRHPAQFRMYGHPVHHMSSQHRTEHHYHSCR
jgi:hypothetical protein